MAESEIGIVLIVVGVLAIGFGFFFWPACGFGIILLVVGIILVLAEQSRPRYYAPPMYPYSGMPPTPPGTAPTLPGTAVPYAPAACPACGSPMAWIAQYGRWYCMRCQAYR